jgi:hypothetical protein
MISLFNQHKGHFENQLFGFILPFFILLNIVIFIDKLYLIILIIKCINKIHIITLLFILILIS